MVRGFYAREPLLTRGQSPKKEERWKHGDRDRHRRRHERADRDAPLDLVHQTPRFSFLACCLKRLGRAVQFISLVVQLIELLAAVQQHLDVALHYFADGFDLVRHLLQLCRGICIS